MTARTVVLASLGVAAVVTALVSVALATPPSGASGTVVARAAFADPTDIKFKIKGAGGQETVNVNNAQDVVMQQVIIAPGGHTGWHSHPGPLVVLIKSGAVTFYDSENCTVRTYSAGQAFVERGQGDVAFARNEGLINLELWITYFDVPPGGPFRLDAANPGNCGF